ncbi:helix-turn-helix transcriptional regulator [Micromonospora sp. Llam7]|uniref:helix-turn-helix domain-containing protein n=1 Tax=Micromonospora tarapacensis TaxID=2835305 RepID=UPI001C8383BD|nr:helix-turn-helix transcriptional regulator [Micromonospora tarapacensis]
MNATGEFGPELRRRRSEQGISLRDLAVQVHCNAGYLSRVERGLRQPSAIIARMCDRAVSADGALLALMTQPVPMGAAHARPELPEPRPATFLVRSFERVASGATVLTDDHQNTVNEARSLFQVLRAQGHVSAPRALLPALARPGHCCRRWQFSSACSAPPRRRPAARSGTGWCCWPRTMPSTPVG